MTCKVEPTTLLVVNIVLLEQGSYRHERIVFQEFPGDQKYKTSDFQNDSIIV
jgi:hypothetical protein